MKLKLEIGKLEKIRDINPRILSYNVEMTEVTGGTFWKAYTPEQIAGTEPFKASLKVLTMSGKDLIKLKIPPQATAPAPIYFT